MKAYDCDGCGSLVFFENVSCLKCHHALGFLPAELELRAFAPAGGGGFRLLDATAGDRSFCVCVNGQKHQACNWMVPADDPVPFCLSCRLNKVIPNLDIEGNPDRWRRLERAKRRAIYTILKLGLPMDAVPAENRPALQFSFLGDVPGQPPVLTGHANGMITINIAEADDAERERRRVHMHEPYRTLLGHFRHEIGHYYWDRLIANSPHLDACRALFGDDRADYAAALQTHYQQGPPANWRERFISAYAAVHPWEDWAETWAHYFHMIDTVETAASFGVGLKPRHPAADSMIADPAATQKPNASFDTIQANWTPMVYLLNSLNRGMGLQDLYPFAPAAPALEKLAFVHAVVQTKR